MDNFQKGAIVYHKATQKRGVIKGNASNGGFLVTTEDDKVMVYEPEELWTEKEYNNKTGNLTE